jgi:hypothetical protein
MELNKQSLILSSYTPPNLFSSLSTSHLTNNTVDSALACTNKKVKGRKGKSANTSAARGAEKSWSEQEELEMLIAHQNHRNNWSNIALEIRGRSNNSIKNRFYSIFRKVRNKIKRRDLVHNSKLEVAETVYVMALIEQYFANPLPSSEINGKRGKDFLYTLLKGLFIGEVREYKRDIERDLDTKITLEGLWQELYGFNTKSIEIPIKFIEEIPYAANPIVKGKQCYKLPLLPETIIPTLLTSDEKTFIKSQAFREKDISSAGINLSCVSVLSSSSPTLFSTDFSAETALFNCFSRVAAKANITSNTLLSQTARHTFKQL